jgi:hypothetical protein
MIINKQTIRQLIIRTAEALGIQHLWLVDPRNYTQFHHPSNDANANANAKLVNNNNNNNE